MRMPERLYNEHREVIPRMQGKFVEVAQNEDFEKLFDAMRATRKAIHLEIHDQSFTKGLGQLKKTISRLGDEVWNLKQKFRNDEIFGEFIEPLDDLLSRLQTSVCAVHQFQREIKENIKTKREILWLQATVDQCKEIIESILVLFENLPEKKQFTVARMKKLFRPRVVKSLIGFVAAVGLTLALKKEGEKPPTGEKSVPTQNSFVEEEIPESTESTPSEPEPGTEVGEGDFDGEGEPGEFEKGHFIGEVELKDGLTVPSLWVNMVSARSPDGKFRSIQREESTVERWSADDAVRLYKKKLKAGATTSLLVPIGYRAGKVKVSSNDNLFSQNGNKVSILGDFDREIEYNIYKSEENFSLPPLEALPGNYSAHYAQAVRELQSGKDPQEVLNGYFGEFTYIVSSELGSLLREMPGTFSEKISGVKVGDCDTMSNHANGMFTDAKKPSLVAHGILREENKLDAAKKHARFVYKDNEAAWQPYELTTLAQGSYVNVKFFSEDKKLLQEKVKEMAGITSPEILQQKYKEFGEIVRTLLSAEAYNKFKAHPGETDAQEESTPSEAKFMASLEALLKDFKMFGSSRDISTTVVVSLVTILVTLLGLWGVVKSVKFIDKKGAQRAGKIREKQLEDVFALISQCTNQNSPWGKDSKAGADQDIATQIHEGLAYNVYAMGKSREHGDMTVYTSYRSKVSLYQISEMNTEQQKMFLFFMEAVRAFIKEPYRIVNFIALFRDTSKWDSFVKDIEKKGVSLKNLLESLREKLNDPKVEKMLLAQVDTHAEGIMKKGANALPSLHRLPESPIRTLIQYLSELGVDRLDDLKTQNKAGAGHELYEIREYRPGDDLRRVNWKASGRTNKTLVNVTAQEQEVGKKSASKLNIVIDVGTVKESEMVQLVGLLHLAQRQPQTVQIGEICFTAQGREIDRWRSTLVQHLTQKRKPENIENLIKRILGLQIKESLQVPGAKEHTESVYQPGEINAVIRHFPLDLSLEGLSLVLGDVLVKSEMKRIRSIPLQGKEAEPEEERLSIADLFEKQKREKAKE